MEELKVMYVISSSSPPPQNEAFNCSTLFSLLDLRDGPYVPHMFSFACVWMKADFKIFQLDHGMRYVWEKIALTLSANRVGLLVGVIGFRADKTSHHLDLGKEALEDYENIWVMRPLELIKMNHLKELQRDIIPSHTNDGDAISAIVVAIDMIKQATILKTGKLGKFKRKIVLLTDGRGTMNGEDLDDIAAQMNEVEIELVVMSVLPDCARYFY